MTYDTLLFRTKKNRILIVIGCFPSHVITGFVVCYNLSLPVPQRGTVDAEMISPSVQNLDLSKVSPFKSGEDQNTALCASPLPPSGSSPDMGLGFANATIILHCQA